MHCFYCIPKKRTFVVQKWCRPTSLQHFISVLVTDLRILFACMTFYANHVSRISSYLCTMFIISFHVSFIVLCDVEVNFSVFSVAVMIIMTFYDDKWRYVLLCKKMRIRCNHRLLPLFACGCANANRKCYSSRKNASIGAFLASVGGAASKALGWEPPHKRTQRFHNDLIKGGFISQYCDFTTSR